MTNIFSKIKNYFEEKLKEQEETRKEAIKSILSTFDDPMINEIEWKPLNWGWTNFKTHILEKDMNWNLIFKTSKLIYTFLIFFLIFPIAFWSAAFFGSFNFSTNIFDWSVFKSISPILVLPIIVIIFLYFFLNNFYTTRTFDLMGKFYYKWKLQSIQETSKDYTSFRNIHAIQIIKEYVRSDKTRFYSYELNLVLKDKTRLNILDHGNLNSIKQDAKIISETLWIPVWDVSEVSF